MAPIRVGILGLSATEGTGASWASNAHLPYILANPSQYIIVALSNSSVEAAKAAILKYNLPSARAYGSPQALANDKDVDLVVCCVRVDKHYETIMPSLEAGKSIYCEWPLGANVQQATEMRDLATKKGVKTMVGLQARQSPVVHKVKEIIASGRVGKVLSTSVLAYAAMLGSDPIVAWLSYITEKKVGGNIGTITFGHLIDSILFAVSSEFNSFSAMLGNQRPSVSVLDKTGSTIEKQIQKDTPDQVLIQGRLEPSNAILSCHLRGGGALPGEPALLWRVYGEDGEIEVTGANAMLMIGTGQERIRIWDFKASEAEDVPWTDGLKDLPQPGRNVGRLYDAFASGSEPKQYPDWDVAVRRHQLLAEIDEMNGV